MKHFEFLKRILIERKNTVRKLRDEIEFKRIYELYFNTVYRVVFIHMKNEHDTGDIVQDVFYKFFISEKEFNDDEHIKAWLLACANNACMDFFRSKHNKNVDLDKIIDKGEQFEHDETIDMVLALPEKYKFVIYMFYYEDYKADEIAKILGIPHATVRIRLKRGRELLKKKLQGG